MDIIIIATNLSMSSLAIVLGTVLVVSFVATTTEFTRTYGQIAEGKIQLHSIPTLEKRAYADRVKEQWVTDFNKLLNESNNNATGND